MPVSNPIQTPPLFHTHSNTLLNNSQVGGLDAGPPDRRREHAVRVLEGLLQRFFRRGGGLRGRDVGADGGGLTVHARDGGGVDGARARVGHGMRDGGGLSVAAGGEGAGGGVGHGDGGGVRGLLGLVGAGGRGGLEGVGAATVGAFGDEALLGGQGGLEGGGLREELLRRHLLPVLF